MNELREHLQAIHDPWDGAGYEISFCLIDPTILAGIGLIQAAFRFRSLQGLVLPSSHVEQAMIISGFLTTMTSGST
jgi:hypothetical protein